MPSKQLDNLVGTGLLKVEPPTKSEFDGLLRSGKARLKDASNNTLDLESRFDLAYNAAHALSFAALRWHGYRPEKRYIVFQCLEHTLSLPPEQWRVLEQAHRKRNAVEYEGVTEVNEQLLEAMVRVAQIITRRVGELPPIVEARE